MKMPNCTLAKIPIEKISEYLLSASHPRGFAKAKWFNTLGYNLEKPNELVESIMSLACMDIEASVQTDYGTKYVIVGKITGPNGRTAEVKSVWMLIVDETAPKLVTAYPSK